MSCPDDDTLAAVATLREAERAAIADHAATCDSCREIVSDLLGVRTKGSFAEAETLAGPAAPSLATGLPSTIDRYRVESRIGAGAMGVVYRGHDPELARPVAIKVLRSGGSPDRMKREAQALAQLQHRNVVAVYDVGEHAGSTFVTMALVDGDNLRTWLQTTRTTAEIIDAIAQAARGLEVAHAAGIVHRDIKPDNIFVAKNGTVLVGDFGLARTAGRAGEAVDLNLMSSDELTQTGALVGTPAYMAPEQIDGEVSPASDQFALCVTAWEALYGERPFTGKSLVELISAINAGPPAWPRTRSVPSYVRAAIRRGLAADPKARHPSIGAFANALAKPRRRWPFAIAAVASLAVAGVAFAVTRPEPPGKACDAIAAPRYAMPPGLDAKLAVTVDRILGRYAKDWHDLASSSCRAAAGNQLSTPAYAATQRCLEDRKDTLLWIVKQDDVLGLAEALEPIETCRGLPDAAALSPELVALKRDLARTAVAVQSEPESASGLEELLVRAKQLDDASSIAEVQYLAGLAALARGLDPIESLQAAIAAAERAHDDRIRTRASALLAIVHGRIGRLSEALVHQKAAAASAARATDAVSTIAVERSAIELAYIQRDFDAQAAGYQRIEKILLDRFGEPSRALVDNRFMHAGLLIRQNQADGHRLLELAVAGWKEINADNAGIALQQAIMGERNPALRLPLQERLVELVRINAPSELPKELEVLAFDYEIIGNFERALQTMNESIGLETPTEVRLEVAAYYAFETGDRSDNDAIRASRLAEGLALLDRLPATARDRDSVLALRGRILLRAGRAEEAIPLLTRALEAAERHEPQEPFHIGIRSFALAQALWSVGGPRDRDRAIALADQAARRLPEARDAMAKFQNGALLPRLDEQLAHIDAWRRTHK